MENPTKRHWNDFQTIPHLKKGPFSTKELNQIRDLLCQWAFKRQYSSQDLADLCSDTKARTSKKVWCKVAQYFPNRSVQSIHNVCKRVFNPNNYKGAWELWEEQELVQYVKSNGHKWKEIGEILNRTALNVKDKWKQMGGDHNNCRKTGPWSASEIVTLIRLVQNNAEVQAISQELLQICERLKGEEAVLMRLEGNIKGLEALVNAKDLNWNAISQLIVTRSEVDCRLKWSRCLMGKLTEIEAFTYEEDMNLILGIETQGAEDISEVDFSLLNTGKTASQNRARFKTLSNVIAGRLQLTLEEVLRQLKHAYTVYEEEEGSIIDFYRKHFLMHK